MSLFIYSALFQTPTPPPQTFWQANQNDIWGEIIVFVITVVLTLIFADPLKALLGKIGKRIETGLEALGFGYRKRYLRHLVEAHQWLKLIGQRRGEKDWLEQPRLEDVYISLQLRSTTGEEAHRFDWRRLFDGAEKRLVILGHPGAGKSTFLDYLTLVFTDHARRDQALAKKLKRLTPVYVRLREVGTGEKKPSLPTLITTPLEKTPRGYFERLLEKGACLVLLDGLDEVLDRKRHAQVVEEIQTLVRDYPENWYLVTCRVAGWEAQLPGFRVYSILDFGPDDIRQFAAAWYREVLRTEAVNALGPSPTPEQKKEKELVALQIAARRADHLWNALQDNPGLMQIASTPLILSLIALVHNDRETQLPKGRAKLYARCMDILLEEWDLKDKKLEFGEEIPTPKDKLSVLEQVAFHFAREGLLQMGREALESLIADPVSKFSTPTTPEKFIQNIHERSGILVEVADGQYAFAHRALMDYLVADFMLDAQLDDMLLAHADQEAWREVILVFAGLLKSEKRMTALVERMVAQPSLQSVLMAGRCLLEDVQVSPQVRGRVAAHIQAYSPHFLQGFSPEFMDWLNVFASLADQQFAAWFPAFLAQFPNLPALAQGFSAILLKTTEANKRRLLNLFLPLAGEGQQAAARAFALQMLGHLGFQNAPVWAALQTARAAPDTRVRQTATWAWCALGRYAELGLVEVPAGEFLMGKGDEQHPLYLPTFYIQKNPVTVEEWRKFVEASGHTPHDADSLKDPAAHPVRYVTWHEARKYTEFYGMTLPSEAEWEKAARGTDGREYPWGDEWRPKHANTAEYWETGPRGLLARQFARLPENWTARLPWFKPSESTTTPVGTFSPQGDSPYGCVDMSGNVWEWTRSIYQNYPYQAEDGRENLDASAQDPRVVRGGAFLYNRSNARCAVRGRNYPDLWVGNYGFRGVVSLFL
ncbi:MAG: hypothetical protein Fur0022_25210 [Anaerolineales bacterium]